MKHVQIYRFNENLELASYTNAKSAVYVDQTWTLQAVENTKITAEKIEKNEQQTQTWPSTLTPDKLGVVTVKPESLSISGLVDYLDYLELNQQDQSRYLLAFWRKIMQPLTVAVMLLLALSFIFGPLRSMSMGARIMMGVVTGLGFHLLNQGLGSMALVYQIPPIVGAILPSLMVIGISVFFINKRSG